MSNPPTPAAAAPTLAGSIRLFRVAGISVYVHWSWLLIAYFELQYRAGLYASQVWNVAEYLSLFVIVLLHEFGHSLACRQVGGTANEIVLWPLGGIAFVSPPPRPGAWLWSIAAGPLVNLVLVPVTIGALIVAELQGLREVNRDAHHFLLNLAFINGFLLLFNLLPVYPLDGGQILQSLLWFLIGRAKSLLVVSIIGMIAAVLVIALAIWARDVWIGIMAVFVAFRSWSGYQQAQILAELARAPRHPDAACPGCGAHPLMGDYWGCGQCRTAFDLFAQRGVCPGCGSEFVESRCPECQQVHLLADWRRSGHANEEGNPD